MSNYISLKRLTRNIEIASKRLLMIESFILQHTKEDGIYLGPKKALNDKADMLAYIERCKLKANLISASPSKRCSLPKKKQRQLGLLPPISALTESSKQEQSISNMESNDSNVQEHCSHVGENLTTVENRE